MSDESFELMKTAVTNGQLRMALEYLVVTLEDMRREPVVTNIFNSEVKEEPPESRLAKSRKVTKAAPVAKETSDGEDG